MLRPESRWSSNDQLWSHWDQTRQVKGTIPSYSLIFLVVEPCPECPTKIFMGHFVVAPMNIESAPVHFCWYLAWWDRGLKGLELGLVNGVTDSHTDTALYN